MTPSYVRERLVEMALAANRCGSCTLAEALAHAAHVAVDVRLVDGVAGFLPPTRAEVDRLAEMRGTRPKSGPPALFDAADRETWKEAIRLLRGIELAPDADVARQLRRTNVYMHVHGDPRRDEEPRSPRLVPR